MAANLTDGFLGCYDGLLSQAALNQ